MCTDLPSASRAKASASCEPMESPSGRACDVSRNRCRERMASRIWRRTGGCRPSCGLFVVSVIVSRRLLRGRDAGALRLQLLQDALDPIVALDALVEEELQLRDPAEPEPAAELTAQERRGALERPLRLA